jgi:D-glycero-alpha-D-manno-heptose 1-phosphate guanylyltransferase
VLRQPRLLQRIFVFNSQSIAAILVGGKGTRLRSVISDVPKPLAPIAGEPFLFIILRQLAALGLSRIVLLTGFLHQQIADVCGDGSQFGLEIVYSQEVEPLGTAGAVWQAKSLLQPFSDFILMNGDTYLDCSLESFLQYPLDSHWLGLIGAMQPQDVTRFGSLQIHPDTYRIEAFREKQQLSTGFVNAGIYRLSTNIFDYFPEQQFCSLENDIFPNILNQSAGLRAFPLSGEFVDIGVPESYFAFDAKMRQLCK